jgi:probable HAF family extracellular repeat protein
MRADDLADAQQATVLASQRTEEHMNTGSFVRLLTLCGALAAVAAPEAWAQGSIVPLSPSGAPPVSASAINASGQVTGYANFSDGTRGSAFLWTPTVPNGQTGSFKQLAAFKGYDYHQGNALNDSGSVVGYGTRTNAAPHALLWSGASGPLLLGPSGAWAQTEAHAINNAHDIVGRDSAKGALLSRLVNGVRKLFIIGPGTAMAINNSGQALVHDEGAAYLWTITGSGGQGTRTNLPPGGTAAGPNFSGSPGFRITDSGGVPGSVPFENTFGDGSKFTRPHPAIYLPAPAHGLPAGWNDLGFPATQPPSGQWYQGGALTASPNGILVGLATAINMSDPQGPYSQTYSTVWVWDAVNGMRDLNVLFQSSGWVLTSTRAVNDAGQILGLGRYLGGPEQSVLVQL